MAKIFQALQGNYGTRFLNQWKTGQTIDGGEHAGKDAGLVNAMATWADKLAGFGEQPERIKRALESLPEDPPSLPKFVEMCRAVQPNGEKPALQHKLTPEEIARHKEMSHRVAEAVKPKEFDGLLWAKRPKSQKAMDFVADGKKHPRRFPQLAEIFDRHVIDGVCNEAGKLLKRWDGLEWVKA